jgi:hypothetical protein
MPLGSVHTISVSAHCLRQLVSVWIGRVSECTLLPLIAVVARNPGLKQHALGVIFGLNKDSGFVVLRCSVSAHCHWVVRMEWSPTYGQELAGAEASAAVIPVIVLELVDLDALAIVERRSGKCHHQLDAAHCLAPLPGEGARWAPVSWCSKGVCFLRRGVPGRRDACCGV